MACLESALMFGNWFYQARLVSPGWQASSSWRIGCGRAEKGKDWSWGGGGGCRYQARMIICEKNSSQRHNPLKYPHAAVCFGELFSQMIFRSTR